MSTQSLTFGSSLSDLRQLSNSVLLDKTCALIREERRITAEVIAHIYEVDRRRLYADRGFPSMYEWLRAEGYSEAAAYRRLSAARLLGELPEIGTQVQNGELSVTVAAKAQSFFIAEKRVRKNVYTAEQKKTLLQQLAGKSTREVERVLAELSPTAPIGSKGERERVLNGLETEIRFVATTDLIGKFGRVRELAAHRRLEPGYAALAEWMADFAISKLDPAARAAGARSPDISPRPGDVGAGSGPATRVGDSGARDPDGRPAHHTGSSRYIPAALRRQVWLRDQGRCTYIDAGTGKRCTSRYRLQVDHIQPYGVGGASDTLDNLRLLCWAHNRLLAERFYGKTKIHTAAGA